VPGGAKPEPGNLQNGEAFAFGAECGSGELTPNCVGPIGGKNILGSSRKLPTRPGKLPLRLSGPPKGTKNPLEEMSRSQLNRPLRRSQKSAITTMSVLSSPVPALIHASHSPISLEAPRFVFPYVAPISSPRNLWTRKKLTTPEMASEPYTAEAPSLRMST